jgi:hypothetical protein
MMNVVIIAFIVLLVILFWIVLYVHYFCEEHLRIVEVEYRDGDKDYTIESSTFFGLPGTWSTKTINIGYTLVFLDGFTLEQAKARLESLKEDRKKILGKRIKNKSVIEVWK